MKVVNPLQDVSEIYGYQPKAKMIPYSEIESERIEAKKKGTDKETVPRSDFIAMLKILVQRATWKDKWRARRECNHWLNVAKREILIG